MFLNVSSAAIHIFSTSGTASCPAMSGSNKMSTPSTPIIFNSDSFSTDMFLVPKQHTVFGSPLSCRFSTSKIPSTNITLPLIGWT